MYDVTTEDEQELMDINDDAVSTITLPHSGKKVKIGYLKPYCTERVTRKLLKSDNLTIKKEIDAVNLLRKKSKLSSQIVALILLNNFFKIKFFYPLYWRWLYYVKEYTYDEMFPIVLLAKKKTGLDQFGLLISVAATIMETQMMLTTKQAKQFRQELLSAQEVLSGNDTRGL